jgi:endonuclease-3 related protein
MIRSKRSPAFNPSRSFLRRVLGDMLVAYGPQGWWPGETPFEIAVGAVLTQNTAWTNVERAIASLRETDLLDPEAIAMAPHDRLADSIRPVGYFNVKAERLRALCRFWLDAGEEVGLAEMETEALRHALLGVHGVGPETADDILLYAFERPVFVIDAYTRRLFERLGVGGAGQGYEALRRGVEQALGPDVRAFNELHALIVRHAKEACRKRPVCLGCCLRRVCAAQSSSGR